MPYFHPTALKLIALRQGRKLDPVRLGQTSQSVEGIAGLDVVIGKTGPQGISYITKFNKDVYERLEAKGWRVTATWPLPDGSEAQIWGRVLHFKKNSAAWRPPLRSSVRHRSGFEMPMPTVSDAAVNIVDPEVEGDVGILLCQQHLYRVLAPLRIVLRWQRILVDVSVGTPGTLFN